MAVTTEQVSTLLDVVRTLATVATLPVIMLGWRLVNAQNNTRESRKELRQFIDRILGLVADLLVAGMDYHSGGEVAGVRRRTNAWKLVQALGQIAGNIAALKARGLDSDKCAEPFILLKQALTGSDFMSSSEKAWGDEDPRWQELIFASNRLTQTLDKLFLDTYPTS